jgi:hypothetical protein
VTTVGHLFKNSLYYLSYDPTSLSLRFLKEDRFAGGIDQTKYFFYTYDDLSNTLTLQIRIRNLPYYVMYGSNTQSLFLSAATDVSFSNPNRYLNVQSFELPEPVEITNDWGSYKQSFNQNNLDLNEKKSFFNIENNFLIHSEYNNLVGSSLKTNILTLKNQLNGKELQGRGNIFVDKAPTFYRNYNTIFSGRNKEKGYEKLHLQYECYSVPL